ncbi:MAG: CPBP family intramembrane metalloprotease [Methylacidiphilales bacterium]|nr:CPBP family intramembrane metalloprotease [Candidatus Methylacidiphilales bacterium]
MSAGAFQHADRIWLRPELIAPWIRVAVTVVLMLGSGIIFGLVYGQTHHSGDFIAMMNDKALVRNGTIEAPLLGLFLLVLRRRGWTRADFRVGIGWLASLEGLGLLALTYVSLLCVLLPLIVLDFAWRDSVLGHWARSIVPHTMPLSHGSVHLSWTVIIACTVLNAFYEEIVYMGYFFNECAAKRGPWMAVVATVLLRLAVHSYQGSEHILQIGVWSLVFGLWYRWGGKVWPLILAHAAIDLFSLGALKILFGNGS